MKAPLLSVKSHMPGHFIKHTVEPRVILKTSARLQAVPCCLRPYGKQGRGRWCMVGKWVDDNKLSLWGTSSLSKVKNQISICQRLCVPVRSFSSGPAWGHSSQPTGTEGYRSQNPRAHNTSHMPPDSAFPGYSSTTEKAPGDLLLKPNHLRTSF